MDRIRTAINLSLFSVIAVVVTGLTHVLGAPALKALRRRLGRGGYWAFVLPVSAALFIARMNWLAIVFLNLSVLIGAFEEFEDSGFGFSASFFLTLMIDALASAGAFVVWAVLTGPKWSQILQASIEFALKPVAEFYPKMQINYSEIMMQLPSLVLIYGALAIFVAILGENRFNSGDLAAPRPLTMRPQLQAFRLPDVCVWIFIASVLGSFGEFHLSAVKMLSVNAMNVCVALFFVQGMMVILRAFEALRMSTFWQVVLGGMIAIQLFLFVGVLGLLDFWIGFRERIAKRAEEIKRET